jgi:PAS domain S-box-containing protein
VAISVFDLEGKVLELNQAAIKLHGFPNEQEAVGRSSFDFVVPGDRERSIALFKKTLEEGSECHGEFTLMTVNGREFRAEVSAGAVRDSHGRPICMAVTTVDITERKKPRRR